jgi:hypothetical protein
MTHVLPCTDCGTLTPTKRPLPKRCAPCAKAEARAYSQWWWRTFRDEMSVAARGARATASDAGDWVS